MLLVTLPPNPPQLLLPCGAPRMRPHRTHESRALYDADDRTPERELLRKTRRLAIEERKASLIALKLPLIDDPLLGAGEAARIERASLQRSAAAAAKPARTKGKHEAALESFLQSSGNQKTSGRDSTKAAVPEVGWYDETARRLHAAAVAEKALAGGGHGANLPKQTTTTNHAVLEGQQRNGRKNWCETCSRGFDARKSYVQHIAGRSHVLLLASAESFYDEFGKSSWFDKAVPAASVTSAWSLDAFVEGLPRRSRSSRAPALGASPDGCIAPHVTLAGLSPEKRGMMWRYLREALLPECPLLPEVVAALEAAAPRFGRVKELLESVEVVKQASVQAATASVLVDVACGHGLVGLLLAFRYPHLSLVSIDRTRRPAFDCWLDAIRSVAAPSSVAAPNNVAAPSSVAAQSSVARAPDSSGIDHDRCSEVGLQALEAPLSKVMFLEGDFQRLSLEELMLVSGDEASSRSARSSNGLVLCVHGCKEVNGDAIELARKAAVGWLVVPCCLQLGLCMGRERVIEKDAGEAKAKGAPLTCHLPDDHQRYAFLCGAIASNYNASLVATLDRRITPRAIVLGGSFARDSGAMSSDGM